MRRPPVEMQIHHDGNIFGRFAQYLPTRGIIGLCKLASHFPGKTVSNGARHSSGLLENISPHANEAFNLIRVRVRKSHKYAKLNISFETPMRIRPTYIHTYAKHIVRANITPRYLQHS